MYIKPATTPIDSARLATRKSMKLELLIAWLLNKRFIGELLGFKFSFGAASALGLSSKVFFTVPWKNPDITLHRYYGLSV